MVLVTEEEALERVNSPNNLTHKLHEIRQLHANRNGRKNIPPMIQALAVSTSIISGDQESSAKSFGMTQENISYLKNESKNEETKDLIKHNVQTVHEKALDSMLDCLTLIKPKLENVKKATELSSIASNLARVVEKTTPKDNSVSTNVKVVVYAPRDKSETEYESMAV